jgi:hypothetical protein
MCVVGSYVSGFGERHRLWQNVLPLNFCTTTLRCPKFDPRHFRQHPRRALLIYNPDALSNMSWAEAAVMCNDGGDVSPVVLGIYFQPRNR